MRKIAFGSTECHKAQPSPPRATIAACATALSLAICSLTACTNDIRPADAAERAQVIEQLNLALADRDESALRDALHYLTSAERERLVANFAKLAAVEFSQRDQRTSVSWRTQQSRTAHHAVHASIDCRGNTCALTRLAGVHGQPAPIWLLGQLQLQEDEQVSVLCAGACDLTQLSQTAKAAIDDVKAGLPAELRRSWDARLVVQEPGSAGIFAEMIGTTSADLVDVAALTVSFGDVGDTELPAMVSVITNPDRYGQLTQAAQRFVMSHEAVHAASDGLGQPASERRWVAEGIAEQVAIKAHPQFAEQSGEILQAACPLGDQPPTDAELLQAASFADLQLAYARAWALIRQIPQDQWAALWRAEGVWANLQPQLDVRDIC